jgi:zinc protease
MSDFPGGWLERQLRGSGQGLAYAVGAGMQTGMVPGYFAVLFNSSPETTPAALQKAMQVVQRAKDETINEADLQRAQAKTLTSEFLSRQSNPQRAMNMALDELYGVRDPQGTQFLDHVKNVDAQMLQDVATRYLHNPVVVIISHKDIPQQSLQAAMNGESLEAVNGESQPADSKAAATQPAE